jgi:hypothetical protein
MALDYSKLSDSDLEALANNDYSKLSDETLKLLAEEKQPETQTANRVDAVPSVAGAVANAAIKPTIGGPMAPAIPSEALFNMQQQLGGRAIPQPQPGLLPRALGGAYNVAKDVVTKGNLGDVMKFAEHPYANTVASLKGLSAPIANATLSDAARATGRGIAGAITAPENLLSLPYQGAAYEQAKIRQNPNAPQYANNPYAMQQRGVAPTQGAAGAMNQRAAVQNFNTAGNPAPGTPQFNQMMASAPAQQPPTAMNFIQRMHQLANQYAPIRQQGNE